MYTNRSRIEKKLTCFYGSPCSTDIVGNKSMEHATKQKPETQHSHNAYSQSEQSSELALWNHRLQTSSHSLKHLTSCMWMLLLVHHIQLHSMWHTLTNEFTSTQPATTVNSAWPSICG